MKIKADKQRAFNTSTMTSSGNYSARTTEETAEELGFFNKPPAKKNQKN